MTVVISVRHVNLDLGLSTKEEVNCAVKATRGGEKYEKKTNRKIMAIAYVLFAMHTFSA